MNNPTGVPKDHWRIAGALFDFAGWLTTRPTTLKVGARHDAAEMVAALKEWAELRGLSLEGADVLRWDGKGLTGLSPE